MTNQEFNEKWKLKDWWIEKFALLDLVNNREVYFSYDFLEKKFFGYFDVEIPSSVMQDFIKVCENFKGEENDN